MNATGLLNHLVLHDELCVQRTVRRAEHRQPNPPLGVAPKVDCCCQQSPSLEFHPVAMCSRYWFRLVEGSKINHSRFCVHFVTVKALLLVLRSHGCTMKFFTSVLLAVALCVSVVAQEKPSDWRAFRGSHGDGSSRDLQVPTKWNGSEDFLWKTDLPGAGTSTPIIVGQRVFVTCYSGYNVPGKERGEQKDLKLHLVCLNRTTGKMEWTRGIEPKLPEQESIRDSHGYSSSTPVADEKFVYAFFGKSGVVAFDHDGKELWRADVGDTKHEWGSAASLLLYGEMLIVNASVESEQLYALDCRTGKEVWKIGNIKESWNTPLIVSHDDKTELVVAKHGKILGIDPKTGKSLWNCDTDIPWYMVPSMVAHDGVVYVLGGRPGYSLAVRIGGQGDVTKTHRLWANKNGNNVSSPIYHEGHLYWMHDNREMAYCAEAKTGKVIYEERVDRAGEVYGSPVLTNGMIYYPTRNGTIFVVAAKPKFELIAKNSLGERVTLNSSPAIAGNCIFLRTNTFLCCIGKK